MMCWGGTIMPDYQKMYLLLFNAITDALTQLQAQNMGRAALILQKAQADAEELYIAADE